MRPESAPPAMCVRMRVGSALHQGAQGHHGDVMRRCSVSAISAAAAVGMTRAWSPVARGRPGARIAPRPRAGRER